MNTITATYRSVFGSCRFWFYKRWVCCRMCVFRFRISPLRFCELLIFVTVRAISFSNSVWFPTKIFVRSDIIFFSVTFSSRLISQLVFWEIYLALVLGSEFSYFQLQRLQNLLILVQLQLLSSRIWLSFSKYKRKVFGNLWTRQRKIFFSLTLSLTSEATTNWLINSIKTNVFILPSIICSSPKNSFVSEKSGLFTKKP